MNRRVKKKTPKTFLQLCGEEVIFFIKMVNKIGPRTEPWGTPFVIGRKED